MKPTSRGPAIRESHSFNGVLGVEHYRTPLGIVDKLGHKALYFNRLCVGNRLVKHDFFEEILQATTNLRVVERQGLIININSQYC